jgi:8-oxo-dGTP pyrophosphatase MutT (NUDIX family)
VGRSLVGVGKREIGGLGGTSNFHTDGHFAKGGIDPKDHSPEYKALREVREETGYVCEVIVPIPGAFESDTCVTKYFLVRSTGIIHNFDHETQEVRWVS